MTYATVIPIRRQFGLGTEKTPLAPAAPPIPTSFDEQLRAMRASGFAPPQRVMEYADGSRSGISPPGGAIRTVWYVASLASSAVAGYHGYKRNGGSVGWAIGWFLLGGLFPVIVPTIAVAQGFGKPKKR